MKNDSGEITMDEFSNTQENATEDKREEIKQKKLMNKQCKKSV